MNHRRSYIVGFLLAVLLGTGIVNSGLREMENAVRGAEIPAPLTAEEAAKLTNSLQQSLKEATVLVEQKPDSAASYSQRGDARFFLGQFAEAVADYDKMDELEPSQSDSNWRRGIALFYAKRYEDAAAQFERYHSFDDVDRENGIWRYLSQYRAYSAERARAGLLKYRKDDREPFPAVYKLFSGKMTPEEILQGIDQAEVSKSAKESRQFYAELYIGLNYAVAGEPQLAREHLAAATRNSWPRTAGFGPNYMWHVGRLHEELLRSELAKTK